MVRLRVKQTSGFGWGKFCDSPDFLLLVKTDSKSNSHDNVYGAVIVAAHCRCESSPGTFDEWGTSAMWPPTFGPSKSA